MSDFYNEVSFRFFYDGSTSKENICYLKWLRFWGYLLFGVIIIFGWLIGKLAFVFSMFIVL